MKVRSRWCRVASYQINAVINKYIEGGNRTNRQKQSYLYGTECYRDLKIILQNRLSKVKSSLRSQLSEEIAKPIYNNSTFNEAHNNIKTLASAWLNWHMAYPISIKTPRLQSTSSMLNLSKIYLNHPGGFTSELGGFTSDTLPRAMRGRKVEMTAFTTKVLANICAYHFLLFCCEN
jgi:hypothetical protein